jgi:hypothetical protein
MPGVEERDDVGGRGRGGHEADVDPRHHHRAGGEAAKVQAPVEQGRHLGGENAVGAGGGDDLFEVFGGGALGQLVDRFDADAPQQTRGGGVEEPDDRPEHGQVGERRAAERLGHRLRPGDGQIFRGELAEHHLHDGCHDQGERHRDRHAHRGGDTGHAEQ